jgi:hypothetical protein
MPQYTVILENGDTYNVGGNSATEALQHANQNYNGRVWKAPPQTVVSPEGNTLTAAPLTINLPSQRSSPNRF